MKPVAMCTVLGRANENRVSRDKEYEVISKRLGEVWSSSHEAMKLFIQTYSAIVGGSVWLSKIQGKNVHDYKWASIALVGALTALCIIMLWDNKGSWSQWRNRLERISADAKIQIPRQHPFWSNGMDVASTAVMAFALALFSIFNPFS